MIAFNADESIIEREERLTESAPRATPRKEVATPARVGYPLAPAIQQKGEIGVIGGRFALIRKTHIDVIDFAPIVTY